MKTVEEVDIMNKERKIGQVIQAIAMSVLFVLIMIMIYYVNSIQGTARVVNYAGLVRGATQRMVKLEIAGVPSDEKIDELDNYLNGIGNGSDSLNLICIKDVAYQDRIKDLNTEWNALKEEIQKVRQAGYENTDVVNISEEYFQIADDVVGIAEDYSEQCAKRIREIEIMIIFLIVILSIQLLAYAWKTARMSKANRKLKEEVYRDKQTGLPNKAKCLELIEKSGVITEPTCVFMFDLNNLKYVNDNLGHESGDVLIQSFARLICENISQEYFVGRYGGDEFIAIITGEMALYPDNVVQIMQDRVTLYNASSPDIPISYAVGYASNVGEAGCTMRILLAKADKYMYVNKKETKESAYAVEKQLHDSLMRVISVMGKEYNECCYYNLTTGKYQSLNKNRCGMVSKAGDFRKEFEKLLNNLVESDTCEHLLKKLSNEYMKKHLSSRTPSYDVEYSSKLNGKDAWWRITVMYVDQDMEGELIHALIVIREISGERELEFDAKHDGMTGLLNKTTALASIEAIAANLPNGYHAMLVCDIDDFKQVNDNFGHIVGDEVIKKIAHCLRETFEGEDTVVSRFGGDEFAVYIDSVDSDSELEMIATQLLSKITDGVSRIADSKITVSIGIAIDSHASSWKKLFQEADHALYDAKRLGKNQFALHVIEERLIEKDMALEMKTPVQC